MTAQTTTTCSGCNRCLYTADGPTCPECVAAGGSIYAPTASPATLPLVAPVATSAPAPEPVQTVQISSGDHAGSTEHA